MSIIICTLSLITLFLPCIEDFSFLQETVNGSNQNPNFIEDPFFVIDNEDIHLEVKGMDDSGDSRMSGWVTFDDVPTNKQLQMKETSPMVEIGYDDLFKAIPDESYVIVSPDHRGAKEQSFEMRATTAEDSPFSSLLTDALSSMSVETRSLFANPEPNQSEHPVSPLLGESTNQEKKKRRPPPRPPLPSGNQGSVRKPAHVALPPRAVPSPRASQEMNKPILTSTAFSELKTNENEASTANQFNTVFNDPFADLFTETRNGMAQNWNKN